MRRPGRPLGVSLAIVASLFLFTLLPLLQVGMILVLRQRFVNLDFAGEGEQPIFSGADVVGGVPMGQIVFQGALSLAFLVIAVLAWRGKPGRIRLIFVVGVVLLTAIRFVTVVIQRFSEQNLQLGISSADSIFQSLALGQLAAELLVTLYVMWYMNRGPARAFYRGYYLAAPPETATSDPVG
ncbi:MAG TPA: hypothetical protein VHO69_19500 [Phototrophicaceae bacterium]|nr:hypothetical protein [Phototrophicaceae bacterium]